MNYSRELEPQTIFEILYDDLNSGNSVKKRTAAFHLNSVELSISGYDIDGNPIGLERYLIFRELCRDYLFDIITSLLNDQDRDVKTHMAWVLGDLKDKRSIKFLIDHLNDKDSGFRRACSINLVRLYKFSLIPVIEFLNEGDNTTRSECAWILGEINDPKTVNPLIKALKDDYWNVRFKAVEALGKKGEESSLDEIIICLGDTSVHVRRKATTVTGMIPVGDTFPLETYDIIQRDNLLENR